MPMVGSIMVARKNFGLIIPQGGPNVVRIAPSANRHPAKHGLTGMGPQSDIVLRTGIVYYSQCSQSCSNI